MRKVKCSKANIALSPIIMYNKTCLLYTSFGSFAGVKLAAHTDPFIVVDVVLLFNAVQHQVAAVLFQVAPVSYTHLKAGIVRCCLNKKGTAPGEEPGAVPFYWVYLQGESEEEEITKPRPAQTVSDARGGVYITGLAAAPRTGQITCTGQPAWSGGCNELQQLPGSYRTGP